MTAEVETYAAEDNSLGVVYVSAEGSDEEGAGTEESPVATLAKAVIVAKDGATIYVMSNLTMTQCARFYGKHLTITSGEGGPYTLTRGDDFGTQQDSARSTYNPALIEVDSTNGPNTASLKLSNIILDDDGKHEGSYFVQADSEGDGHTTVGEQEISNTDIVQDGIIATYNGVGTITLGEGTVLKNYGGMCAVRLSGGELIMEEGSQIIDEREITREKGATGSFGPAGAIWIQGGTLTMKGGVIGGAEGVTMNGRAVYVDSGTANVGGTIQNIKGADAAWQGQNGVAVHLRSHGEATLTSTGKITNVTGTNAGNNCAIWTQFCNFTTENGSEISNVDSFQLLHFDDLDNNNYSHRVFLDGRITDCDTGSACLLRSWYGQITFGPNSVIENCSSSSAGGLIYSNNGSHYTFAGTIRNNKASKGIIYLANQSGGGVVATIKETAHIVDNESLAIRVNNSSNLTMNGGEISRNGGAGVQISGKSSWKGVKFIMEDGVIANNEGVGVDAAIGGNAVVQLKGGDIYGNGDGTEVTVWNDYTDAPAAYGQAESDNLFIGEGVLQGARTVKVKHGYSSLFGAVSLNRTLGTVTLDEDHGQVAWAFANTAAVTKMTSLVTADTNRSNWKAAMEDAYWITPKADSYHFVVTRPEDATKTDLYLAYIPMNDDGNVPEDAELTLKKVGSGDEINVTMDDLDASKSYAFMFFNSSEYTITASAKNGGKITPSGDVTVAEGDNQTFTITANNGYRISDVLVDGKSVGAVASYTFKNVNANHTITVTFEKKSSPPVIIPDDDDDQPEDPDDTGVSDLLNTKDHDQYLFGYPEGTFGPGLNMTRAEAAQMFYNLLVDQDVTAKPVFDDVPEGAWYAEPVNVMAKLDIVEGVGDDKFEPNREITRAEFTAMAMRFAQGETGGKNIFSDVDEDDWFYDVVVDSIKYGWIEGYPDGTFRSQNLITREEVTTIVNRMLGRLPDEKFIDAHEDDLDLFPDVIKNWAYYDVVEATNDHQYKKTSSGEDWTKLG